MVRLVEYSKNSGAIKLEIGDLPDSIPGPYVLSPAEAVRLEKALFYWRQEVERHGYGPERIFVDDDNCVHIQCRKEDTCANKIRH